MPRNKKRPDAAVEWEKFQKQRKRDYAAFTKKHGRPPRPTLQGKTRRVSKK